MDITLNQEEIETAIVTYIGNQGININNKKIEVSLTAGRGVNGHSASVTLLPGEKKTKQTGASNPDKPSMKEVLKEKNVDVKPQTGEPELDFTNDGADAEVAPFEPDAPVSETDSLFGA